MLISIHEMRRRAPLHFQAKADNARFIAYVLSNGLNDEILRDIAVEAPYGGTPSVAAREGFQREAAIAVELMIKAVVALKIELEIAPQSTSAVKATHNVVALWQDAGLPKLSAQEREDLLLVKRILFWSGRYAAPKSDEDYYKEEREFYALRSSRNGSFRSKWRILDWDAFEKLYGIAREEFWSIWKKSGR